jgi:hypothetical protein
VPLIRDIIGHFVIEDQIAFVIHSVLDVVSDLGMMAPSDGHGAGIGIGEGHLFLVGLLLMLFEMAEALFAFLQMGDDFLQFIG